MKNDKFQNIERITTQFIAFFKSKDREKRAGEDDVWNCISNRIEKEQNDIRKKIYLHRFYKTVAVAASLFICFYVGKHLFFEQAPSSLEEYMSRVVDDNLEESDQIQLLLSDNEKLNVDKDSAGIVYSLNGKIQINNGIARQSADVRQEIEKEEFNQIIVPKGKYTSLTLSDGTTMHINSGTRVVYPRIFTGKRREIYVDGEAYLNVTKNKDCPFIVKTSKFDVQVLGTSFNVNAYKTEKSGSVVLVNGSVRLSDSQRNEVMLKPDNLVTVDNGIAGRVQYVDAHEYIAWVDGLLIAYLETLENVFRKLNRFYGVNIIVSPSVESMLVDGKLDLRQPLPELIRLISEAVPISYKEVNGVYYINKK